MAGTALVAAASLPVDRPGIGWLCSALAGAAATGAVARRANASGLSRAARARRVAWGIATVALLSVGTIRAAGWLFTLCVLAACVTGSLAVGGGGTVPGLVRSMIAVPVATVRGLPWASRGLAALRRDGRGASTGRILVALAVTAILVLVFGALFASADAVFATLVADALPDIDVGTIARWVQVSTVVGLLMLGVAYTVTAPPRLDGDAASRSRARLRRIEWALPLGVLDVLFLGFVLVQLTVLFGGASHVLRTADLTYAEYARRGFWQLLAVTVLTLAVLGAAARWAPRQTPVDRALVRTLLGGLAVLTLVIVASALYRMQVYEHAYGFTRLRLFVQATELWLGVVFVLVLIAGLRPRAAWLPQMVMASAVVVLLAFAALNPDRFIADRNIDRYQAGGRLDVDYLARLSADAVPALDRLTGPRRDCALDDVAAELRDDPDDWRGFNLGRAAARTILGERPPAADPQCWRLPDR